VIRLTCPARSPFTADTAGISHTGQSRVRVILQPRGSRSSSAVRFGSLFRRAVAGTGAQVATLAAQGGSAPLVWAWSCGYGCASFPSSARGR
jgi:hypothetical protein